jgi:hypothetical protein
MRQKTITKKAQEPVKQKHTAPIKLQSMTDYFKDIPTIKMSVAALLELQGTVGWQIIISYLKETKENIIKELQIIDTSNPTALNRINQLQSEVKVIDYIMSLPNVIIDSYNNDLGGEILDPYS